MSGPKISYYNLSTEQKKLLRAQWQCYRDTLACIVYVKNFTNVMDERSYELLTLKPKLNRMAETNKAYSEIAVQISELAATLHQTCADFKAKAQNLKPPRQQRYNLDEITLTEYKKTRAMALAVKNKMLAFYSQIETALETARNAVTSYEAELYGDILQVLETPAKPAVKQTINHQALDLSDVQVPGISTAAMKDAPAPDMEKLKSTLADKLEPYVHNTALPTQLKAQINGARLKLNNINSLGFLKNFYAIAIKPLLTESEHALARHTALTAEYYEHYSHYLILCQELNVTPEPVLLTAHALKELQGLMADMEQAILHDAEQAQVCKTIDAVMTDMGYTLLGKRQVVKKSGRRFKHELYTFEEGTAVDITYADNGQITMELGGLDYTDRLPNAAETQKLCQEMEHFCREFKTIETSLAEHGVIMANRIEAASDAPEYAVIINLGEYEKARAQKVEVFSAQAPKTSKPKT